MAVTGRGAFIVFEGCDRSGKTTQSNSLFEYLTAKGVKVKRLHFPDRDTYIGQVINSYLKNNQELSDEVIHLLFVANRWEYNKNIRQYLEQGITLVVDRYSYSGIAYSVAKGLSYEWCYAPEVGLIRPDVVFYMQATSDLLKERSNFGEERYENLQFQAKISKTFDRICNEHSNYWHVFDAKLSKEEIQQAIRGKLEELFEQVSQQPLTVFT